MIPKKIHFCWFSGEPYPDSVQRCLDSWSKHLTGFELIKWDTAKARATGIPWVQEALEQKKKAQRAEDVLREKYGAGEFYPDRAFIKDLSDRFFSVRGLNVECVQDRMGLICQRKDQVTCPAVVGQTLVFFRRPGRRFRMGMPVSERFQAVRPHVFDGLQLFLRID